LPRACSWEEKPEEISQEKWDNLRAVYDEPNDVDLFTGGLSETQVAGGLTGPTFNCLKGQQFEALRNCDRFFVSHEEEAGSLTDEQYATVLARGLRDVLCDNTEVPLTQLNPFEAGAAVSCDDEASRNELDVTLFL